MVLRRLPRNGCYLLVEFQDVQRSETENTLFRFVKSSEKSVLLGMQWDRRVIMSVS